MCPQEHLRCVFCSKWCCTDVFRFGYLHLLCCEVHFLNSAQVLLKWRRCVLHLLVLCLFAFVVLIQAASGPSQTTAHKSANGVTFLSVRLSIVMKPNTSSGSSSSLSSGTSDCWRKETLLTKMENGRFKDVNSAQTAQGLTLMTLPTWFCWMMMSAISDVLTWAFKNTCFQTWHTWHQRDTRMRPTECL